MRKIQIPWTVEYLVVNVGTMLASLVIFLGIRFGFKAIGIPTAWATPAFMGLWAAFLWWIEEEGFALATFIIAILFAMIIMIVKHS